MDETEPDGLARPTGATESGREGPGYCAEPTRRELAGNVLQARASDRDDVGMLIFADLDACCSLCPDLFPGAPAKMILRHGAVRAQFQSLLESFSTESTGSSRRVVRALLLEEPSSLDEDEITDKGSLNQSKVLQRRAALVEELYRAQPSPWILRIGEE